MTEPKGETPLAPNAIKPSLSRDPRNAPTLKTAAMHRERKKIPQHDRRFAKREFAK
jgi:hypothetical protein